MAQDPFKQMKQRMQQVFNEFDQQFGATMPKQDSTLGSTIPIDMEETDDAFIIRADMPGVEKDHIDIEAGEDSLEITADDDREVEREEKNYYRRERSTRSFYRRISLPAHVDPDTAEATYENGVLEITLHKAEANTSHIDVK